MSKSLSKRNKIFIIFGAVFLLLFGLYVFENSFAKEEKVIIETSKGSIIIELYPEKAPITVENFINYVNDGFYDGLVFHRIIDGFMIQGGGFTEEGTQKKTNLPIILESKNGLSNRKYTIAMARTFEPNSATSQFFINTNDNIPLDYGIRDDGYAVFGKVIEGQDVVDEIEKVKTATKFSYMENWPVENIIIKSIKLL